MNLRSASFLLLPLLLGGCAKLNEAGMWLVASDFPTYAVVNNTLLSGTTTVHVDRTGAVSLGAVDDSGLKCMGGLRYTGTRNGVIRLQCSDGTETALDFIAIRETSGHASGRTASGQARLAFGLEPEKAIAYLGLPPDRLVTDKEGKTRLVSTPRQ